MRSVKHIGRHSASIPLLADEIVEFHAARLLLLLSLCGVSGRIEGLTKMAKLDFFARYPDFFVAARRAIAASNAEQRNPGGENDTAVEAAMIRHHYGPWDKRYYHVLAHLEAKRLITVTRQGKAYRLSLTDEGSARAKALAMRPSFAPLAERMRQIKAAFGAKSGDTLKKLIYRLFDQQVARRAIGEVISP